MRLRKFRVKAYRCIHDSGEINVGDLAAFVGRNESGKTTILQALTLLNRETIVSDLDLCDELSESLKSTVELASGTFELNPNEIRLIKESFPQLDEIKQIRIIRTNKDPKPLYDFGDVKVSDDENDQLNSWENFMQKIQNFIDITPNHISVSLDCDFFKFPKSEQEFMNLMTEFNNTIQRLAVDEPIVIREWDTVYKDTENSFSNLLRGKTERDVLENFVETMIHPRFVYFSDYKKIYGNVNLNEYSRTANNSKKNNVDFSEEFDKAETVRNLFYLAELDIDKMNEYRDSPSKIIKFFNIASKKLTAKLNPAWKGDPLLVELRYNPGNIISLVISDVHKDGSVTNTGLLNRRAEGFKWTFSFIVNFAAETQRAELKEAILLLDEPARNLHPIQQRGISDLLKNLAGSNQVLYATHSPFMIFDYTPGNLLVVELDKRKHLSKIFYDYWNAEPFTLIPILYGLSRGQVETIMDREIGTNSRPVLIVETISDYMYLNAFDKFLEDPNISVNPLNIIAAHTKDSVLPLAIFYAKNGYNTFVMLDNTAESKHIASHLLANNFTQPQIIFFEKNGKPVESLEDYIETDDYLYAVNQTYEIKLRKEGYRYLAVDDILKHPGSSIISKLDHVWNTHDSDGWEKFNKEEITRYICEKIALNDAIFITDKTKDAIRTLYRLITERIIQYKNMTSQSTQKSFISTSGIPK
ncbi:MAG: AAA family ATPase [Candidatus Nitrosoabyssus spongiisocia]|nr:MAG: AAA family ATPase [Nitrosopumilaceae archaeon AB1(1)]